MKQRQITQLSEQGQDTRVKKRKLWLLGIGTVLLAVLTALFMMSQQQTGARVPVDPPPQPGGSQTAQDAYIVLKRWAESWAEDTAVVTVSASMVKDQADKAGLWTFLIYSAERNIVAVISVRGGEIIILREQAALYPQQPIDAESWQMDSRKALTYWWQEHGQATWARSATHSLHIRLANGRNGSPMWQISVLDTQGNLIDFWEAQADTDERVSDGVRGEEQ